MCFKWVSGAPRIVGDTGYPPETQCRAKKISSKHLNPEHNEFDEHKKIVPFSFSVQALVVEEQCSPLLHYFVCFIRSCNAERAA